MGDLGPAQCIAGDETEYDAVAVLRYGMARLGTWRFDFGDHNWSEPLTGDAIFEALDDGAPVLLGWAWDEMALVEITDFSGAQTLLGVIGYLALVAVVGTDNAPPAHSLVQDPMKPSGNRAPWRPRLVEQTGEAARPLFTSKTIRRATVSLVASADVAHDPRSTDSLVDGLALSARFGELIELGLGVRHARTRLPDQHEPSNAIFGFLRLGAHFPLDAGHRWGIPLSLDLGVGGGARTMLRLNFGVRYQLTPRWFIGLQPLNPTAIEFATVSPAHSHTGWWFTSGLEAGFVY